MDAVLAEVQRRPYSLQPLSIETISDVWSALCQRIHDVLMSGKGIGLPAFGVWTFRVDPLDLGNKKKTLKTPVFVLSEKFARSYNINFRKQLTSGGVPVSTLNSHKITEMSGHTRDETNNALKDIFLFVGDVARSGRTIRLDFYGVGQFVCTGCNASFTFYEPFANTYESMGFSSRAPLRSASARRRVGGPDWSSGPVRPLPSSSGPGLLPSSGSRPGTAPITSSRPPSSHRAPMPPQVVDSGGSSPHVGSRPTTAGSRASRNSNSNHTSMCRCKHCQVRRSYNQQIADKYALMGVEEAMDKELIEMAKTKNQQLLTQEANNEATRRAIRHNIEEFNARTLLPVQHQTKSLFGPESYGDMFQYKIEETRETISKADMRQVLMEQAERKRKEKEEDRRRQLGLDVPDAVTGGDLEQERQQEQEERKQAMLQRRKELLAQMAEKRPVLPDATSSAVWDGIPRTQDENPMEKRQRQRKMQEETLESLRRRERKKEEEKLAEQRKIQDEIAKLQDTIQRTEQQKRQEDIAKKKKARDIWTSQIMARKQILSETKAAPDNHRGLVIGGDEPSKHCQHQGQPVPLSAILQAMPVAFR